jgi:Tfp pilus assembly protein PilO
MNKGNSKASSLILVTSLLGVVILVAAWFLLISPVLSGASEASTNAAAQEEQNANTQVEVNKLKEQYANLADYQQQLEGLQVQIPTTPMYPELQRMFADVAAKHGVVVTALQFGTAQPYVAAVVTTDSGIDDGTDSAPAPSASPSPSPTPGADGSSGNANALRASAGQYAIPVTLTVAGAYDNVMATLKELQNSSGRLVLITDVTVSRSPDSLSSAGGALPKDADTTGVFAGSTFVLTSSTPTEQAPADSGTDAGTTPSASPTPSS